VMVLAGSVRALPADPVYWGPFVLMGGSPTGSSGRSAPAPARLPGTARG
jgi:hypothetical protein